MNFEWDETKRGLNLARHGLDFDAVFWFDWENSLLTNRTREGDGELRYAALGMYNAKLHTVVFAKRGTRIRIISFRRSNRKEEKAYDSANAQNKT